MKNLKSLMTVILILTLLPVGSVFAGDSKTIAITCTIPAIPGVNAPLLEAEAHEATADDAYSNDTQGGEVTAMASQEAEVEVSEQVSEFASVKVCTYCEK
ncbi:MAG: hypothetical protein COV72_00275 [Candidatus Omnitrophica bacterium CG11_big_fil_rev_8_21_14_0_20_42_13]|uniref:Secreted protein n=1 Tax=Candidatus Ghiorseimicrobium undicola TaxID=1974746 RepID=A0A2H0M031_9BACT|nr:MAG: hypothetical protein COV72_00275 [Candidatus Omnitrophica bacterium CG11_big_fil_rev_8_21_14_0_20_42_13]